MNYVNQSINYLSSINLKRYDTNPLQISWNKIILLKHLLYRKYSNILRTRCYKHSSESYKCNQTLYIYQVQLKFFSKFFTEKYYINWTSNWYWENKWNRVLYEVEAIDQINYFKTFLILSQ